MNTIKSKRVPAEAIQIGKNLRDIRKLLGLSQVELGNILDISFQQIQKYERGQNRFPVDKLYLMSTHFGVPYEIFFLGLQKDCSKTEGRSRSKGFAAIRKIEAQDLSFKSKIYHVIDVLTN